MALVRPRVLQVEDEESYFVSMTDIVIGLLFIFIIMLMYFAMRFQQASSEKEKIAQKQETLIENLTDAEATRTSILEDLKALLKKEGIDVTVVKDEGILRLPEKLLFASGRWEINNTAPIKALASALDQILPCYTKVSGVLSRPSGCPDTEARIEAIFIEGHADFTHYKDLSAAQREISTSNRPLNTNPTVFSSAQQGHSKNPISNRVYILKDNLDLSALRATSTFRGIMKAQPDLGKFLSPDNMPVLSVSGYGSYRQLPREKNESEEAYKQRLRRIDLRLLMATPRSETARRLQKELERTDKP
jgi:chemotaxis protein MotB